MGDNPTVFPYDDEVTDPYEGDDTKNPHEESGEPAIPASKRLASKPEEEQAEKPARRVVKSTKTTRTAKKK